MKPGWKTTEFWLSLAAQALGVTLASGAVTNESALRGLGLASSLLAALGYTLARAWTKASDTSARAASLSVAPPSPVG